MRPSPILLAVMLTGFLSPQVGAWTDPLKPVDQTKQADVNGKNVSFGDVPFGTISQPMRDSPKAPLTKGDLKLENADLKERALELKTVEMTSIPISVLPKANFTAKRAAADKPNDQNTKQVDQTKQKAPISERQIRPFMPGGEEELKKQLNEPH